MIACQFVKTNDSYHAFSRYNTLSYRQHFNAA